jgi:TonB family protein
MKKTFLFFTFFLCLAQNILAQEDKIYDISMRDIDLPDGFGTLAMLLQKKAEYPTEALEGNIVASVSVIFVLEKDGTISTVNTDDVKDVFLKAEIIRVLKTIPTWKATLFNNKPVRCHRKFIFDFNIVRENGIKTPKIQVSEDSMEEVFQVVEQQAEYTEGQAELFKWIEANIKYPNKELQGKVIMRFIVEKDGSITNVVILRGTHTELDAEAVRVVKSFPTWKPGRHGGNAVRSYFTLPIVFKKPK